jgi:hypothetical protein
LTKYGEVNGITEEQWSRIYRYPLYNGVRLAEIALQKHIHSHMIIMGNHILLSLTCYSCEKPGHQRHECPQKKTTVNNRIVTDKNTWAHVVTTGTVRKENTEEGKHGEGTMPNAGVENSEDDRFPIERGTDQQQHDDTATYIQNNGKFFNL